jgi:hypothetical protein
MQYLWQSGFTAPGMSKMRVLSGKTDNPTGIEGIRLSSGLSEGPLKSGLSLPMDNPQVIANGSV